MKRRKLKHDDVAFQMTPMIDMTFLLLIFFMVTSKLSKDQIKMEIKLPHASSSVAPEHHEGRDIINLDADGNYFLGDRVVSQEELKQHLTTKMKLEKPPKIYLRADAQTSYEKTQSFMKLASEAGAGTIIFATYGK